MPSSAVYEAATRYRAALLARERRAATALVRYYGEAWARLSADIVALTKQVEGLRAEGLAEEALRGRIMRLDRLQAIQSQVEAELRQYAALADQAVQDGKRWAVAAAEREAYELVQLSYPRGTVAATFYRMPREAAESLIGTLQDGTPLRKLIEQYVGDAAQALSERMVTGLVAGWNPRKLARELRKDFGMGLTDSLRLARTEQLRAYRTATLESYKANGDIVKGWRRLAAKDSRTCAACLFLDGKEYSTQEEMDDHPNGRCALVPIAKTYAELGIDAPEPQYTPESGREWFERQDEATQRKILGTGRYDAWKAGAFELEDIPHKTHDPVWGDSWTPRPLWDLLGAEPPVRTQ